MLAASIVSCLCASDLVLQVCKRLQFLKVGYSRWCSCFLRSKSVVIPIRHAILIPSFLSIHSFDLYHSASIRVNFRLTSHAPACDGDRRIHLYGDPLCRVAYAIP